jgi:hypothetical protein
MQIKLIAAYSWQVFQKISEENECLNQQLNSNVALSKQQSVI